ncbi:MAG: hypothetical protein JNM97_22315 [Rhodoferax sp.]|nr:hypothetical protein [Rhodoferax sp.]
MRLLPLLSLMLLSACTHTVTLFPRGGGEQAMGTLNDMSKEIEINLKGDKYTGTYTTGRVSTFGTVQTYGARPTTSNVLMSGSSNQAAALLTGPKGVLRCEFVIEEMIGGNGVCVDTSEAVYDMLVKVKQ